MFCTIVLQLTIINALSSGVGAAKCSGVYSNWVNNYDPGERLNYLVLEPAEVGESGGGSWSTLYCMVKGSGSNDEVLDPFVSHFWDISNYVSNSMLACKAFSDVLVGMSSFGGVMDEAAGCSSSGNNNDNSCSYPNGLTNWGGQAFKISRVNGIALSYIQNNGVSNAVSHFPVYGTSSSYCTVSDAQKTIAMYDGGVITERTPIPGFSIRTFNFKSDAEREMALLDSRNYGLKYAQSMTGANGCDQEVIMEVTPAVGQQTEFEISIMANSDDSSVKVAISDTMKAYVDTVTQELIVSFDAEVLRKARGLDVRDCDMGQELPMMKFSTSFICKDTEERVNMTTLQWKDASSVWGSISTNSSNPSVWNSNGATYDPFDFMSDWRIYINESAIPSGCGNLYWDPLLSATYGDGRRASFGAVIAIITVGSFLVLLASGYAVYHFKFKTKAVNAISHGSEGETTTEEGASLTKQEDSEL
jgi:hypothetical protein